MSVDVVMPQMGESITEGTVSKWLKRIGERIEKDEPVLEISTDKVDAEVPSPGAGTLLEIRHQEGDTVEVGTVLAVIGAESEQPATSPQSQQHESVSQPANEPITEPVPRENTEIPAAVPAVASTPGSVPSSNGDSVEVIMPQMGESITEGTVSKWLKAVGEKIDKDEPLLEISTDKVDAEVPSPAGGTLLEIVVNEGETVEVGAVLRESVHLRCAKAAPSPQPSTQPTVAAPSAQSKPEHPAEQSQPQVKAASAGRKRRRKWDFRDIRRPSPLQE